MENLKENVTNQPIKKKKASLIVLGVIALVFYLAITIIGIILTASAISDYKSQGGWAGLGIAIIFVFILIYGTLASLAPTGVSIAGLIVSIKKAKKIGTSKLWIVGFAIMIVLPFLTIVALLTLLKLSV